jgi:hypothetical protein
MWSPGKRLAWELSREGDPQLVSELGSLPRVPVADHKKLSPLPTDLFFDVARKAVINFNPSSTLYGAAIPPPRVLKRVASGRDRAR